MPDSDVIRVQLDGEAAMVAFGKRLGELLRDPEQSGLDRATVVSLEGELGAGKTTLCRGVLRAFGHSGAVKSPTYTLVEPYAFGGRSVYHFDLYRLGDPEELEFLGVRDYFDGGNLCLIEWPKRGEGFLPAADLAVKVAVSLPGRRVTVTGGTEQGRAFCHSYSSELEQRIERKAD